MIDSCLIAAILLGTVGGTALFIYGAWWLCRIWSKN